MSVGLFHQQPYGPGHSSKADHEHQQRMLAFALLETVRIVLEEGRDSEDSDSPVAYDNYAGSDHPSSDSYQPAVQRRRGGHNKAAALLGGPCAHCGATESPQWRRPLTKKVVLCNACGIYFSRHHSLPKRKKVVRNNKRAQYEETEDTDSGELDTLEADTVQQMLPEVAAPPVHHPSKKAHLRSNIKRTDSSSSADCVQHAPPALVSPVQQVSAAAAAALIAVPVLAQTLEPACAPAPAAGGTYVAATRATRKRRATGPIQPSQDNGAPLPQTGAMALPPSVATPRPAIAAKSPGLAAATGADSPAGQTVATVADSPASSPSALGAGVCLAFAGAATAQTSSPPHSCTGLIQAGMSHQQPQSMAQAVNAMQGRTSTNEVPASTAGPNTILIPVTTCRGPRKTPSRKPSNVSSFGVLPQL